MSDRDCATSANRIRLTFEVDGSRIFETELHSEQAAVPFQIEFAGGRELSLRVQSLEEGAECGLVGLTRLRSH